jgi:5-methylthioadenosine/S-adenosylhomocysteine deaminase
MGEILIKNGFIATMDPDRTIHPQGSLLIEDDCIVDIGKDIQTPRSPEHVIDANHKVILPGFVNAHAHLQQYFRGVYELIGDFYKVNLPLEGYRQPDDMDWLGDASCAELIHGGSTTSMIIYTYPDGFARSIAQAGNRVILAADIEEVDLVNLMDGAYHYLPEKGEAAYRRAVDLHNNWHCKVEGRITTVMAPKAADLSKPRRAQPQAHHPPLPELARGPAGAKALR